MVRFIFSLLIFVSFLQAGGGGLERKKASVMESGVFSHRLTFNVALRSSLILEQDSKKQVDSLSQFNELDLVEFHKFMLASCVGFASTSADKDRLVLSSLTALAAKYPDYRPYHLHYMIQPPPAAGSDKPRLL